MPISMVATISASIVQKKLMTKIQPSNWAFQ